MIQFCTTEGDGIVKVKRWVSNNQYGAQENMTNYFYI